MEDGKTQPAYQRRSMRIVLRLHLYVNSSDSSAVTEWEPVETIVVSRHGGLIRTRQKFAVGSTLDIRMRDANRSARGRVAWTKGLANWNLFELGFEILDETGFWDIDFPFDRWPESTLGRR